MKENSTAVAFDFEPAGFSAGACWKVEFSGSEGEGACAFWTGRAATAERAKAVARLVIDESWRSATGSEEPAPGHVARHATATRYSANDFSKRASRSIGDAFSGDCPAATRGTANISEQQARDLTLAVCASDSAIFRATTLKGVYVAASWTTMNGLVRRKFAQLHVKTIDGIRVPVAIGRATEVALLALAEVSGGRDTHASAPLSTTCVRHVAQPIGASATLRAAHERHARAAVSRSARAVDFFAGRGRDGLALAIEAQARLLAGNGP